MRPDGEKSGKISVMEAPPCPLEPCLSVDALRGRRVAVVGFGNQGRAHALNLRDSGIDIRVAGRPGSDARGRAASDGFITRVFVAVGGLIGVVGSSLGTSSALIVAVVARRVGIPLDPEVYYIERLPVIIAPWDFSLIFVTAVIICLLAAAFPAWLAGRLRPVEGLRLD